VSFIAEKYTTVAASTALRSQAYRIWIAVLLLVSFWALLILAAPIAKLSGAGAISSPLYGFFSYICHQMPERSLHVFGEQMGVCSRCFGVYLGLVLGVLLYPLWRGVDSIEPPARFWLFIALVPIGIDWSLTAFGIWENTQASRLITGLILGTACATFIIPALVEITRNYRPPNIIDSPKLS
jgi:uncharacterized membrane protein